MNKICEICGRELYPYQKKYCSRQCNGTANNRRAVKRRAGVKLEQFAQAYIDKHPGEAEIIGNFMYEWEKVNG